MHYFNGERLKIARLRAGLTQKRVANELKIGESTYNRYENQPQTFDPSCNTLAAMADLFKCSADYLLSLHNYFSREQEKELYSSRGAVAETLEELPAQAQEDLIKLLLACGMLRDAGLGELLDGVEFPKLISAISELLKMAIKERAFWEQATEMDSQEAKEASLLRIQLGCIDKQAEISTALIGLEASLKKTLLK